MKLHKALLFTKIVETKMYILLWWGIFLKNNMKDFPFLSNLPEEELSSCNLSPLVTPSLQQSYWTHNGLSSHSLIQQQNQLGDIQSLMTCLSKNGLFSVQT